MARSLINLAICLLLCSVWRAAAQPNCTQLLGGTDVTVLMVADPGGFTGSAEAKYYLENLENEVTIPGNSTICVNRFNGQMMGQNVSVVSSGIGPLNAALCTSEVLECAANIKDFIYSGTSGWSTAPGGTLNPLDCSSANSGSPITRIGDVCVSPFSNNWDCKLTSFNQQCSGFPNQCFAPAVVDDLTVEGLYGKCSFDTYNEGNVALSDEIITSSQSSNKAMPIPARSEYLTEYENLYWAAMSNGTGQDFLGQYDNGAEPVVWDYNTCGESDSQFFWSGAPWDYSARQYVAYTIGLAMNTTKDPSEVITVSAMEAIGVSAAMYKYSAIPGNPTVPYTIVRSNSDYVHLPVTDLGDGMWEQNDAVPTVDFASSYAYAIASYSTVVLNMIAQRCMTANGGSTAMCTMKAGVQYSVS